MNHKYKIKNSKATNHLRKKMKTFFATVKPEELVSQFEKLGYTFINVKEKKKD